MFPAGWRIYPWRDKLLKSNADPVRKGEPHDEEGVVSNLLHSADISSVLILTKRAAVTIIFWPSSISGFSILHNWSCHQGSRLHCAKIPCGKAPIYDKASLIEHSAPINVHPYPGPLCSHPVIFTLRCKSRGLWISGLSLFLIERPRDPSINTSEET